MADTSAQPEDGDHIVDVNGVVWLIENDTARANARWRATVDRDSVRAYDTPDEDPVVFLDQSIFGQGATTTRELTDKINEFARGNAQNIMLRVRASPDAKGGGIGAGLFIALLVIAALAESGKRRR